jgi:hypothetical protein
MVMAYVQMRAGNLDSAFDYLEQLLSAPSNYSVAWIEADPLWDKTRDHPRYREIVNKYRDITF